VGLQDAEFMNENISEFAKELLQDSEDDERIESELPIDSEVQSYLDEKKSNSSLKKKKRKLQGYRIM